MKRTLDVVFDEIRDYPGPKNKTFYGLSGLFEDGDYLRVPGKETREEAQALRAQLIDCIGEELDYYLEDEGQSAKGRQKWLLKAILNGEGGAIYGKPPQNAQGGRPSSVSARGPLDSAGSPSSRPEPSDKDAEIRAAVALKAACNWVTYEAGASEVIAAARYFQRFLEQSSAAVQSSGPTRPIDEPPSTPAAADPSSPRADVDVENNDTGRSSGTPSSADFPVAEEAGGGGGKSLSDDPVDGTPSSGTIHEWDAKGPAGWEEKWEGMGIIGKE